MTVMIRVIILAVQVIFPVNQKPTQIAVINPLKFQQMMKSIFNLKDKEFIESLIHSTDYFLIHLLYSCFFF